jgi:hypothetical protein
MAVVLLFVAYSLSTLVLCLSEVVLVEGEVGTDIYLLDDGKLTVSTKEHGTVPLLPIQSTTGHSRTYPHVPMDVQEVDSRLRIQSHALNANAS